MEKTFEKLAVNFASKLSARQEIASKFPVRDTQKIGFVESHLGLDINKKSVALDEDFVDKMDRVLTPASTNWGHPLFNAFFQSALSNGSIVGSMFD